VATRTVERTLDAMPDTIDFRDLMYSPALIEIPPVSDLESYRAAGIPILDQGSEGACTGFGLATVANFLLRDRGRKATADETSAWMLYAMAKRYDEWPGEQYSGSSARAAMKGWHKHGVCGARLWKDIKGSLTDEISADAIKRPIGAYFHVPHGIANAMLLPVVLRYSLPAAPERYRDLAEAVGVPVNGQDAASAGALFADWVAALARRLEVPSLRGYGLDPDAVRRVAPQMAADALASGSPANNPRVPSQDEIIELYRRVYE